MEGLLRVGRLAQSSSPRRSGRAFYYNPKLPDKVHRRKRKKSCQVRFHMSSFLPSQKYLSPHWKENRKLSEGRIRIPHAYRSRVPDLCCASEQSLWWTGKERTTMA